MQAPTLPPSCHGRPGVGDGALEGPGGSFGTVLAEPSFDFDGWISQLSKQALSDLLKSACPCVHSAWAAFAKRKGVSASTSAKKFDASTVRQFLITSISAEASLDDSGSKFIGISISCGCASST